MKITKKGNWFLDGIWLGKCKTCAAEAEAMTSELAISSGNSLSNYEPFALIRCVYCKTSASMYFQRKKTQE
jgi:hypothetical protein